MDGGPPLSEQVGPEFTLSMYAELRSIARRTLADWKQRSFEATALVHEAWLRMRERGQVHDEQREEFFARAAVNVRRVLIDHYRGNETLKRAGGSAAGRPLVESVALEFAPAVDLLALDDALEALAEREPRRARLVELRFFGGLTIPETARVLGVAPRTVDKEWRYAKAWLKVRLEG
jgi:RNA polymerase sigma factor (TIGR02999 family)